MTDLKLDFDTPTCPRLLHRARWLARLLHWTVRGVEYRRTRHGWHVVITIAQSIAPTSLVAAQAILGSDWRRESFNLLRARHLARVGPQWRQRFNVLYHHDAGD